MKKVMRCLFLLPHGQGETRAVAFVRVDSHASGRHGTGMLRVARGSLRERRSAEAEEASSPKAARAF